MGNKSVHTSLASFMWWSDSGSSRWGKNFRRFPQGGWYWTLRFPWGKTFSIVWRSQPEAARLRAALDDTPWGEPFPQEPAAQSEEES